MATIGDTMDFNSSSGKTYKVAPRTFCNGTNIKIARLDLVPESPGNFATLYRLSPYSTMRATKDNVSQIATSYLEVFDKLPVEAHLALRADICMHIFAPTSLGVPTKSNEEFASHLTNNIIFHLR
jgi:hypothetical protein